MTLCWLSRAAAMLSSVSPCDIALHKSSSAPMPISVGYEVRTKFVDDRDAQAKVAPPDLPALGSTEFTSVANRPLWSSPKFPGKARNMGRFQTAVAFPGNMEDYVRPTSRLLTVGILRLR
eukprot:scaffold173884_cov36-Prasinocladus_malaysianus.AAC.1